MHEVCRGTGPTGEPNSPSYVIKAKHINRQLVQMVDADASSGGSEAERSDNSLSNSNGSDVSANGAGVAAGKFLNVINNLNSTAGTEEDGIDEEEDANVAGIGADDVALAPGVCGDKWVSAAVSDAADVPAVVGDGVPDAVARPREPGRSCALSASHSSSITARAKDDHQRSQFSGTTSD